MTKRYQGYILKLAILAALVFTVISCVTAWGEWGAKANAELIAAFGYWRVPLAGLLSWLAWIISSRQRKIIAWLYAAVVFTFMGASLHSLQGGGYGYLIGDIAATIAHYIDTGGLYLVTILMCAAPFMLRRRGSRRASGGGIKELYDNYLAPELEGFHLFGADEGDGDGADEQDQRYCPAACQPLQDVLDAYDVAATVETSKDGYSAVKYYIRLDTGTPYSRVTKLRNDIALALGKIGNDINFEMENKLVTVSVNKDHNQKQSPDLNMLLRSVQANRMPLAAPVGVDSNGQPIFTNLFGKTHMIIGGGSGSGKTTWIYSFILGLAWANSPEDLEMVIIDGKSDLVSLRALPHLSTDIIFEYDMVNAAADFVRTEMEYRRREKIETGRTDFKPLLFLIEEIDTVLQTQGRNTHFKDVLTHLARQARSVNILLVLTSQNPSKKTIDSDININFLSRLCLLVESMTESQIILGHGNTQGAALTGKGDFWLKNDGRLTRGQGYYITEKEVQQVTKELANVYEPLERTPLISVGDTRYDRTDSPQSVIDIDNYRQGTSGTSEGTPGTKHTYMHVQNHIKSTPPDDNKNEARTGTETGTGYGAVLPLTGGYPGTGTRELTDTPEDILRARNQGMTIRKIAAHIGRSNHYVHDVIHRERKRAVSM